MKINTIDITAHVTDRFIATAYGPQGQPLGEYGPDYVPEFMPGRRNGDCFKLQINNETGQILNWSPITEYDLEDFKKQTED